MGKKFHRERKKSFEKGVKTWKNFRGATKKVRENGEAFQDFSKGGGEIIQVRRKIYAPDGMWVSEDGLKHCSHNLGKTIDIEQY